MKLDNSSLYLNNPDLNNSEEIRYQERLFRVMADNSKDLIVISNLEGKYLFVSPSSKTILGYTPEELVGTYYQQYVPANNYQEIKCSLDKDESDKINTYTYRFRHKDGNLIWLESTITLIKDEITGESIEFMSISRDITERLRTEKVLKESERRHRILVEESPSSIIVYQQGKWVYINETGAKLLGASRKEEIIGLKPHDFIHPDYHDLFRKQKRKVQQGKTVNFVEEKWIRLDGKVIEVEIKALPFTYDDKPAIHIVINDISEKKKMYELAQKAEKLFLVGQLAAGLAHEIRNPLTSIKGFLQLIKADNPDNIYFDVMLAEIDRIDLITSELLLLAKPKFPPVTSLDIKLMLEQVLALINTDAIMHNIQLIKRYDNEPIWIEGNENQIKQVFINIIKNAIEATPNNGQVVIEVIKEDDVIIRVIDYGCGIPEEKLKKIGEPFYTTKEKGTGLGMMVSYNIIENHRGKINVTSKINKGTIFDVRLPIYKKETS